MPLFPEEPSPRSNWIHAHCDGGSRGNPGPSGFGAVITDAQGTVIAELSEFLGVRTNNFAEYSGLLAVLAWALEHGHTHLKVVSDSELMVKQIQGKYRVNSVDLKPLWQQARDRIARLEKFEITHALRHKNKEADALANAAMDRGTRRITTFESDDGIPPGRAPGVAATRPTTAEPVLLRPRHDLIEPREPTSRPIAPTMLRGFTKDGVIHLLGGATLPDGIFVKIIRE
jgi:probable phosphoglycerate mutase